LTKKDYDKFKGKSYGRILMEKGFEGTWCDDCGKTAENHVWSEDSEIGIYAKCKEDNIDE